MRYIWVEPAHEIIIDRRRILPSNRKTVDTYMLQYPSGISLWLSSRNIHSRITSFMLMRWPSSSWSAWKPAMPPLEHNTEPRVLLQILSGNWGCRLIWMYLLGRHWRCKVLDFVWRRSRYRSMRLCWRRRSYLASYKSSRRHRPTSELGYLIGRRSWERRRGSVSLDIMSERTWTGKIWDLLSPVWENLLYGAEGHSW